MSRKVGYILLTILILIGLATSWHLYETHLQVNYGDYSGTGICDLAEGISCEAAAVSDFSTIFGVPIAVWGFGYYLGLGLLLLFAANSSAKARSLLIVFSGFSILYSLFLFSVSMLILDAVCPFCFLLYAVNIAFFFILPYPLGFTGPVGMVREGVIHFLGALISLPMLVFIIVQLGVVVGSHSHMKYWIRTQVAERYEVDVTGAPRLGDPDAPVQIVVFSDLECPFCAKFDEELRKVVAEHPETVVLYFRHFPLDPSCNPEHMKGRKLHLHACTAAELAVAAQQQGKFWEVSERFFEIVKLPKEERTQQMYIEAAEEAGVDLDQAEEFINSGKAMKKVMEDIQEAFEYDVNKTPTVFINGRKIVGTVKPYALEQFIEREQEEQDQ